MATGPKLVRRPPAAARRPVKTAKRGRPKGSKSRKREHAVALADLFMWISISEACLEHPVLGLSRASSRLRVDAVAVHHCINRLEAALPYQLVARASARDPRQRSARRMGVLPRHAVLFAEICVCIEHLWTFGRNGHNLKFFESDILAVKDFIFSRLAHGPTRGVEKQLYGEMQRARAAQREPTRLGQLEIWGHTVQRMGETQGKVDLGQLKRMPIPE